MFACSAFSGSLIPRHSCGNLVGIFLGSDQREVYWPWIIWVSFRPGQNLSVFCFSSFETTQNSAERAVDPKRFHRIKLAMTKFWRYGGNGPAVPPKLAGNLGSCAGSDEFQIR